MAYIPGPWMVGKGTDAGKIIADGNLPVWIAEVRYLANRHEVACLMAAAPDLLAACEAAVETFDDDAPGSGLTEKEALAMLRAAIAKARGRV